MNKPPINNVVKVLFYISGILWGFICVWAIRDGWFPTEKILLKHPSPNDNFYTINKIFAVMCPFCAALFVLLARKLNRPYGSKFVWFAVTIISLAYALFMSPVALIVLAFWFSKNNRKYHFEPVK